MAERARTTRISPPALWPNEPERPGWPMAERARRPVASGAVRVNHDVVDAVFLGMVVEILPPCSAAVVRCERVWRMRYGDGRR